MPCSKKCRKSRPQQGQEAAKMRLSYHRGAIFEDFELKAGMPNLTGKRYPKLSSTMHPKTMPKPCQKCIQTCITKRNAFHSQIWLTWSKMGRPTGSKHRGKIQSQAHLKSIFVDSKKIAIRTALGSKHVHQKLSK